MDLVNQLFALLRDTWEGVIQPFFGALYGVALGGPWGILAALVIVMIVVYAYQEAKR